MRHKEKGSIVKEGMNLKLNNDKIAAIIVLVAVAVTTIWGFLGGWDRSWIAMLIGVVAAGIVRIIGR